MVLPYFQNQLIKWEFKSKRVDIKHISLFSFTIYLFLPWPTLIYKGRFMQPYRLVLFREKHVNCCKMNGLALASQSH